MRPAEFGDAARMRAIADLGNAHVAGLRARAANCVELWEASRSLPGIDGVRPL